MSVAVPCGIKKQVFSCFSSEVVATVALFCDKSAKRLEKLSQTAQKTGEICMFTENQVPLHAVRLTN
jgi:hypothetical protein